jgi:hypothetical protein
MQNSVARHVVLPQGTVAAGVVTQATKTVARSPSHPRGRIVLRDYGASVDTVPSISIGAG